MISVCIATYNGEKYIKEQLISILGQIKDDDEVIISDDNSTDDTIHQINSLNDNRIKIFINNKQKGFVNNFENALSKAKGDYIFLSDQDDIWKSNKVRVIINALQNSDLIVHNAELIDSKGNSFKKDYYSCLHNRTDFLANLWKTRFLGCCMAFNRTVLEDCLPFPRKIVAHDYWIGMYSLCKYKVEFIPDILLSYRRHGNNVSQSSEKSNNSIYYKIFIKRLNLLVNLFLKYATNTTH